MSGRRLSVLQLDTTITESCLGLSCVPLVFQGIINNVVPDFLGKFSLHTLMTFENIPPPIRATSVIHIKSYLVNYVSYATYVKTSCMFQGRSANSISFLGYMIGQNRILMDTNNVKALRKWSTPHTLKELQHFLKILKVYMKHHFSTFNHATEEGI